MSESTPLIQSNQIFEDEFEKEELEFTKSQKFAFGISGTVLALGTLYFFVFFLPNCFIPQAVKLSDIHKISELNINFAPLTGNRVKELGLISTGIDTLNDAEAREFFQECEETSTEVKDSSTRVVERLIMVGDVHGHYRELQQLLNKIKFSRKSDHLLLLGDFVSKGPDSQRVLDFAIENKIDCILGNHEYYAIKNYALFHGLESPSFADVNGPEMYIEGGFNDDPEFLMAKKFEPRHINYINNCSVIKKLGKVPLHKWKNNGSTRSANGVAVHAGLRWDLCLEDQDPIANLEMRSYVGPFYNETTDDPHQPNAISWSKVFNKKQEILKDSESTVVYYGHDARRELNLKKYTKGLDTGCDNGKLLTAVVIWNEEYIRNNGKKSILFKEEIVKVQC